MYVKDPLNSGIYKVITELSFKAELNGIERERYTQQMLLLITASHNIFSYFCVHLQRILTMDNRN